VNTIVVVKLRAIGDAVVATPAIRALKRAYPSATLVVITTPVAAPIFERHPLVDRVFRYHKRWPALATSAWRVVLAVRAMDPDLVVNLHASFHSAWLSRALGAPTLVVHNHSGENYFSTVPLSAPKVPKSAIERDLDAVRALGIPPAGVQPEVYFDPRDAITVQGFLDRHGVTPERHTLIAVNAGASRPTKRWPLERYVETLRRLGLVIPDITTMVLGGSREEPLAQRLATAVRGLGWPAVAATGFTILETAALLSRCRLLLGNDAGTHHLAAALGVPSVTLFGPERPQEWHPYEPPKHVALSHPVHCVNCGLFQCDRLECLRYISVEEVVEAVRGIVLGVQATP